MPRDVIYSSASFIAFQIFREGRGDGVATSMNPEALTFFNGTAAMFDSATEFPDVCQFSGNSSRSSHTALATFEIAVAGAGTTFLRSQLFGIHSETQLHANRILPS